MRQWVFVLLVLVVTSSNGVGAASINGQLTDYYHEHFTTRDGLPHNTVNAINQSSDGYLWLAGWEGVSRFNGRNFEWLSRDQLANLPDAGVTTMFRRSDGALVIAGARGSLVVWQQGKASAGPTITGVISDIEEDSHGAMWVATEGNGLYRINALGQVRSFELADGLPTLQVHQLHRSRDNKLYLATVKGLFWLDPALETPRFQPISRIQDVDTFAVTESANGSLLVGTARGGFSINQQQVQVLHKDLATASVSVFVQDAAGPLWIGTQDQGLFRLAGEQLDHLDQRNGLPDNRIISLFQDRDLNLWVGTNVGLYRMRNTAFRTLTTHNGLSDNYIRTLLPTADGAMWIGSGAGLDRYFQGRVEPWRPTRPMHMQSYRSLAQGPEQDLWVGTFADGAIQLKQGVEVARYGRNEGLASDLVSAILPLENGQVWFGTNTGLSLLEQGRILNFHVSDGLPGEFVSSIRQDSRGDLWICTNGGVAIYRQGRFEVLDNQQLLPAMHVFDVWFEPNSARAWLATDRGLAVYDAAQKHATLLTALHGFPVEKIFTVVPDEVGSMWMSSNHGIARVSRTDVLDVIAGTKPRLTSGELFGVSDGMRDAQCNGSSMTGAVRTNDGMFWFATASGVARLQPSDLSLYQSSAPQAVIEKTLVDGSDFHTGAVLSPTQKRIEIRYIALSFQMPTRIRYKTKLVGFDADWVERGAELSAEYTNLPPGDYEFLVTAAYPGTEWHAVPASLRFQVASIWWQRPWFICLMMVLLLGCGLSLHRWHLRHLGRHVALLRQQVRLQDSELQIQAEQLCLLEQDQRRTAGVLGHPPSKINPDSGLPTEERMQELVTAEYSRCTRSAYALSLVAMSIERWHELQQKIGKQNVDLLTQLIGELLHQQLRAGDWVGHWQQQQFLLVLPQTRGTDAEDIAQRLQIAVQHFHEQHAFVPEMRAQCAIVTMGESADLDSLLVLLQTRLTN